MKKINFVYSGNKTSGFGVHAHNFYNAMKKKCEIEITPLACSDGINIILNTVNHPDFYKAYCGYKIAYIVWESTLLPPEFFKKLLEFDEVWVPSNWQRNLMIEQGYSPNKIFVVPEGVDEKRFFPVLDRIPNTKFTFLVVGKWEHRKATTEIIQTYVKTFANHLDVQMLLMVNNPFTLESNMSKLNEALHKLLYAVKHPPKIKFIPFVNDEEYNRILQRADAFISCSRAEGWNLPLIEAMACGIPSVCSKWGAQLEFHNIEKWQVPIKGFNPPKEVIGCEPVGLWAEPDFDQLASIMYKLYQNKKDISSSMLNQDKLHASSFADKIRKQFTWDCAAEIAEKRLQAISESMSESKTQNQFVAEYSFNLGAKCEIKNGEGKYQVEFVDKETDKLIYRTEISAGSWAKTSDQFFRDIVITVKQKKEIIDKHEFNANNKKVLIQFQSKSLGDTIAWLPYCEEFRKKHNCQLYVSTFHNYFFKNTYPNIQFLKPSMRVGNPYATYHIGVFEGKNASQKSPIDWRTVPLQKIASDILGLEYREIRPAIDTTNAYKKPKSPARKYICISEHSTAVCKYWHYPNGWQELVDELNKTYNVVCISSEKTELQNIIDATGNPMQITMGILLDCEMYIGVASGLAWLAWALGKKVIIISGFSEPYVEMKECIRIAGQGDCVGCLNDVFIPSRSWDEGCFHNKDFQCSRLITPTMVLEEIKKALNLDNENSLDFTTTPILRNSSRQTGFKKFLEEVYFLHCKRPLSSPHIVEIGALRRDENDPDLAGDGNSTEVFSWFSYQFSVDFTSVEINAENYEKAKSMIEKKFPNNKKIKMINGDGLDYLKREDIVIDALYLDSFDYEEGKERESEEWHLEATKLFATKANQGSLIMIDDILDRETFRGKGRLAIPWLLETGQWELIHCGYQAILRKK